jgi:hypothetical protein
MRSGAATPEELDTLFEDALVIRDASTLSDLFAAGAVLTIDHGEPLRDRQTIVEQALAVLAGDRAYVSEPERVVYACDLALIVAAGCLSVARRCHDGSWRFAIVSLVHEHSRGATDDF